MKCEKRGGFILLPVKEDRPGAEVRTATERRYFRVSSIDEIIICDADACKIHSVDYGKVIIEMSAEDLIDQLKTEDSDSSVGRKEDHGSKLYS